MKITCITVGKVKEKFYQQAIAEFQKRLSKYIKLERQIKDTEGERILKHIREKDYVIALAIEGKMMDSLEFSRKLEDLGINGTGRLVFVIGGSLGLSESVLKRSDEKLSFSRMTFPHQLMRVILLEQIYRGFRIMHGEPYHK